MDKNVKMKSGLLIAAVLVAFVSVNASLAYEPGKFPGKGSRASWQKASVAFNAGHDQSKAGNLDKAIEKYQEATVIYPYSDGYFHDLAVAYARRGKPGDFLKSENSYRKATQLCPTDWRNWNGLAGVLGNQKKYKECRDAGLQALKNNPPPERIAAMKATIEDLNRLLAQSN